MDKKRLLRVAVASVMALSVVASASVSLGNDAVLTVSATTNNNTTTVSTAAQLVEAVNSKTAGVEIKLTSTITLDEKAYPYGLQVPSSFNGTIELNGKDLIINTSDDMKDSNTKQELDYGLTVRGNLTIKDSSTSRTGYVKAIVNNKNILTIDANVTGSITSKSTEDTSTASTGDSTNNAILSTLTINGGKITGNVTVDTSAYDGTDASTTTEKVLTISNGTFIGKVDLSKATTGSKTISGGVFKIADNTTAEGVDNLSNYYDGTQVTNSLDFDGYRYVGSSEKIVNNMKSLGEFDSNDRIKVTKSAALNLSTLSGIENAIIDVDDIDPTSYVIAKGKDLKPIELGDTEVPKYLNDEGEYVSPEGYTLTIAEDANAVIESVDTTKIKAASTGDAKVTITTLGGKLQRVHNVKVIDVQPIKVGATSVNVIQGNASLGDKVGKSFSEGNITVNTPCIDDSENDFVEIKQGKVRGWKVVSSQGTDVTDKFYYDDENNKIYTLISDTTAKYTIELYNDTEKKSTPVKVTINITRFALNNANVTLEVGDRLKISGNKKLTELLVSSNSNTKPKDDTSEAQKDYYIEIDDSTVNTDGVFYITAEHATTTPVVLIVKDSAGNECTLNVTVKEASELKIDKTNLTVTAGDTINIKPTSGSIRSYEVFKVTKTGTVPEMTSLGKITEDGNHGVFYGLAPINDEVPVDSDKKVVWDIEDYTDGTNGYYLQGAIALTNKYYNGLPFPFFGGILLANELDFFDSDGCLTFLASKYVKEDTLGANTYVIKCYTNTNCSGNTSVDITVKVNPFALKESAKTLEIEDEYLIPLNNQDGYVNDTGYEVELVEQKNASGTVIDNQDEKNSIVGILYDGIATVDILDHEGNVVDDWEIDDAIKIVGKNPGTAKLKVTDSEGNEAELTITVSDQVALKIEQSEKGISVVEGQSAKLNVTSGVIRELIAVDSENDNVESKKGIIENLSEDGSFNAVSPGTVYIKAYSTTNTENATPVVIKVDVVEYKITNLENKSKLYVGDTFQLESNSQILGCTSDDTSVATVTADGKITAVGEGIANITIRDTAAETSKTNTHTITIMVVNPVDISFKKESYETEVDKEVKVEINAGATVSEWKVLDKNGKTVTGAIVESDGTSATIKVSKVGEYNVSATNGLGKDSTVPLTVVEASTTDTTTTTEEPDNTTTTTTDKENPDDTTTTTKPDDTTTTTEVTDTPINPELTDRELARLVLIKKQVLGVTPVDLTTGDVNGDDQVNVIDVMARKNELIARGYQIVE